MRILNAQLPTIQFLVLSLYLTGVSIAHAEEWLTKLRSAMSNVDDLRAEAPQF